MVIPVIRSEEGFSLVELMVSMVILTIALLGILQALTVYTKHNLHNLIRENAVRISQDCLQDIRHKVDCPSMVSRRFRNFSIDFYINAPSVTSLAPGNNNITITISFTYPFDNNGTNATYTLNSVVYIP